MKFRKITPQSPLRLPIEDHPRGIVCHWTAGRYGQTFPDYHFCVDQDGTVYQNEDADPGDTLSHTWQRNTGNVGIAAMAMYGATTEDYGKYPITSQQIEGMAALCARLMKRYGMPISSVISHAEAADKDDYGPATTCERWDLWKEMKAVRKKALWYLKNLK
jgi:N-acetyl-anhydromuramyl-L-alanine amidase AmpD